VGASSEAHISGAGYPHHVLVYQQLCHRKNWNEDACGVETLRYIEKSANLSRKTNYQVQILSDDVEHKVRTTSDISDKRLATFCSINPNNPS
jgi:hypothetical protein